MRTGERNYTMPVERDYIDVGVDLAVVQSDLGL
jgi:hypothetical protein